MPTYRTTAERNQQIRDAGATSNFPSYWTRRNIAENIAPQFGLSPITVANVLRGRDLQPRQPRNRAERRAAVASRTLGLDRRFGVEIEFFGPQRYTVQAWLDRNQEQLRGWRVKSDCSVSGSVGSRHCSGLELVSPPLRGEAGLTALRFACEGLVALGAQVNRTAGLHVHHDASDIGATGIVSVVSAYAEHQSLINWLVAPTRRGDQGGYAKAITPAHAAHLGQHVRNHGRLPTVDRYCSVNVNSFAVHGTLEVRQHQGTLSFRKIESWIRLGQGLMDAAAEQRRVSATGLRSLLEQLRVDEDAAAYLLGRALQFQAPTSVVA